MELVISISLGNLKAKFQYDNGWRREKVENDMKRVDGAPSAFETCINGK